MSANTLSDDELFAAVDHHVDTEGMSYDEARVAEGIDALPTQPDDNEFAQYLSPGAQALLGQISAAKHLSELRTKRIWPAIAEAAGKGEIPPYEVDELRFAIESRRNQLTGHGNPAIEDVYPETESETPPPSVRPVTRKAARWDSFAGHSLPKGDRD